MALSFSEQLFKFAKSCWPREIEIVRDKGAPIGWRCEPSLLDIYKGVEFTVSADDEWKQLAAWSFHQALWETLEMDVPYGREQIGPDDVQFAKFDRMMKFNLSDEAWKNQRQQYEEFR